MENRPYNEHLSVIPFKDAVVPLEVGLDLLAKKSVTAISQNLDLCKPYFYPDYDQESFDAIISEAKGEYSTFRGGFGFTEENIAYIYSHMGDVQYESVIDNILENYVAPTIWKTFPNVNPNSIGLGMILDVVRLINPEIASFREGIGVLAKSMKKRNGYLLNNMELGIMVGEVVRKENTDSLPFDIFADSMGAAQLAANYISHLNEAELRDFRIGTRFDGVEWQKMIQGFSPDTYHSQ